MISSSGLHGADVDHGIQLPIRCFSGAVGERIVGGPGAYVEEHSHDWPVLSLYVMGSCRKIFDGEEITIDGPSAVLHGSKQVHANHLGKVGLEQIDVQFDPRWLGKSMPDHALSGIRTWVGGQVSIAAGRLARLWSDRDATEPELSTATKQFLQFALSSHDEHRPPWLQTVARRLEGEVSPTSYELARELDLHPGWLAQAYRRCSGEGIRETLRRKRVEHAASLLRTSRLSLAEIAVAAGFCDQSHMNRGFRTVLGRTPLQVRVEQARPTVA